MTKQVRHRREFSCIMQQSFETKHFDFSLINQKARYGGQQYAFLNALPEQSPRKPAAVSMAFGTVSE